MTRNANDRLTVEYLLDLIKELCNPDLCRTDHHGGCITHFRTAPYGPCPHGRAQRLFADLERNSEY